MILGRFNFSVPVHCYSQHGFVGVNFFYIYVVVVEDSRHIKDDDCRSGSPNTGYDQSQGRRHSTLKCIGSISKGGIDYIY